MSNLRRIADATGVDAGWLLSGAGEAPKPDLEAARSDYLTNTGWRFRPVPPDQGRDYGNPNVWTIPWNVRTLVKEAGQNSLDAAIGPDIEMRFKIIHLKGQALRDYLRALRWDGVSGAEDDLLSAHVEASVRDGGSQKLGTMLGDGVEFLKREKELLLLIVEDYGTVGLVGPEFGERNFAALCRNNLDSAKEAATAGGSYGLGKAVFARASRFATVVFYSNLSSPQIDDTGAVHQSGRLIGRTDLTWHRVGSDQFAGPGWFGRLESSQGADGHIAVSIWDNPTLTHDLFLDRMNGRPGTSVAVVGFHDPGADSVKDMRELAAEIAEAVAENFWPAIVSGRLVCAVEAWEGRDFRVLNIPVDPATYRAPFVATYNAYLTEGTQPALGEPGSVVQRTVTLRIPATQSSTYSSQSPSLEHGDIDHDVVVLVRRAEEDDPEPFRNLVAFFRGNQMVVKYWPLKYIRGIPFQAVVLCGTAASGEAAAAERFLRLAEPPAHDDWEATPALRALYRRGVVKAIDGLAPAVQQAIYEVIRPRHEDLDEGPDSLKELLRISRDGSGGVGGGTRPGRKMPQIRVQSDASGLTEDGRWSIIAALRIPDGRAWRITPALIFAAESGGGEPAEWELEAIENCRVNGSQLIIPAGTRQARFRGVSITERHPAPAAETAVTVVVRAAAPLVGGEQ